MTSLNELAWNEIEQTIAHADSLGIIVDHSLGGTLRLDAGVSARGGLEAGLAMARISMSGLGWPCLEMAPINKTPSPWVTLHSDHPYEGCFLSQSANWQVEIHQFHAMGSGPACLLNHDLNIEKTCENPESSNFAVLVLEATELPEDSVCLELAQKCGVKPDHLAVIVAPTSSLAGSVQVAARSLETGLHKLHTLGFDLRKITSGMGRCPVAVPTGNDLESLGKTNDMVIFGSQVWLSISGVPDNELADWALRVPAITSPSYGENFLQTLKAAGGFYAIDPGLFAPAEVTLVNIDSGGIFHAGAIDWVRLTKALGV